MSKARRIEALRARLNPDEVTALVITDPVNVAYVTAFDGVFDGEDAHAAVITPDTAVLYTDSRYGESATTAAEDTPWEVRIVRDSLYIALCQELVASGVEAIGVESSVPQGRFRFISEQFRGHVEAVDQWCEELRQCKEPAEIECIEAAQELTDRALGYILPKLAAGASEWDVALELEMFMRREGSEGVAFPPIVASGPNSAMPHARVTHRRFEAGDFVKLDFGARVAGYCADMTRTVVIGPASDTQRQMYEAVLAANLAGIAAVKPGLPGSAIDSAAREVLVQRGFGEQFTHGLGHGVGLEVHELPGVGPRGKKSVLKDSVITIEPGVYVPGFGGVRIEDLVVVGESGARVLTTSPKDLIEL